MPAHSGGRRSIGAPVGGVRQASDASPAWPGGGAAELQAPARAKVLNLGISTPPRVFSIAMSSGDPTGGWTQVTELHTDGLITSDFGSRRQIGRLAEKVPTVDDGTVSILPDGRMRVLFTLRKGVTWHDGTPFTAHDLVFSYQLGGPGGLPNTLNESMRRIESVQALDDSTFVILYKAPYYLATALGPHFFWPLPRHILGEPYERAQQTASFDEIMQHAYWTSEYVHLGAFRLISFDPGDRISFEGRAPLTAAESTGGAPGRPVVSRLRLSTLR